MPKAPFERILSQIDRRKILQRKISLKENIVCKISDGTIVNFVPVLLHADSSVEGLVYVRDNVNVNGRNVTAMFRVDKDLYFITSKLLKKDSRWRLVNSAEFYLLNRRESFRIEVPPQLGLNLSVNTVNRDVFNVSSRIVDFSSGGLRLRWAGEPLEVHDIVKGHLLWFRDKKVPVTLEVRHASKEHCGLQFINMDAVQVSRLRNMSIELQQMVHFN